MTIIEQKSQYSGAGKSEHTAPRQYSREKRLCWNCKSYQNLCQAEWEDEYFVFDPASGDTHLLNLLSMEILRLLSREALYLGQVRERLQTLLGDDELLISDTILEQHLLQLNLMGLIVPHRR